MSDISNFLCVEFQNCFRVFGKFRGNLKGIDCNFDRLSSAFFVTEFLSVDVERYGFVSVLLSVFIKK